MAKIDDSVKKKVPELRFKGFTDEWEERKLGDLATSFEYGLNASAKSFDGTHKYIRITDIDDSSRKFNSQSLTSPDIDLSSADNYKLKNGDILFARTGASVGKSYIYADSDGLVYYAGFLIRARIKSGVDSNFVFQHTLTSSYENFIRVTSQRSGQPGVNAKEYSTFEISVPSYEEQRKIGSFFKQLDDTITLHQRKLDLLKEQKKGYLQKMFPKNGAKVPELRFAGFADDWEERKFKDILKTHSFRSYLAGVSEDGEYEVIQQGDKPIVGYSDGEPFTDYKDITLFGDHTVSLYKPKSPFFVATDGVKILSADNFEGDYLYTTLERYKPEPQGYKRHFTILKNQDVWFTENMEEQQKIGVFFKQLDDTITLHQRKLDLLKEQKKGFLQKMFV
ncbi:restriction endonuclease subunit S [Enterococcus faecalis]|nr:restriction endonuclease subunit S [Enterococcus faecalis]EGO9034745.1 restriction endonuclease subunit S [Enterococcus faecalis]EHU5031969.1 restriction endonuclease subunit S [Enterococcus faecalis]